MFIYFANVNDNRLLILKASRLKNISQYINTLICFGCGTGDRQIPHFSRGSGTQTASRFSSTSCRGSSYFSFCWPWWRPSLGRPPVPACRTSTGTPPIQCKSLFYSFCLHLFALHLFRVIIFYHTELVSTRTVGRFRNAAKHATLRAGRCIFSRQPSWADIEGASCFFVPSQE